MSIGEIRFRDRTYLLADILHVWSRMNRKLFAQSHILSAWETYSRALRVGALVWWLFWLVI